MKKILVFAGSNSTTSINHKLVRYAASQINGHTAEVIKLTDYGLPFFSVDMEREEGFPENLKALNIKIQEADALIVSVNEHNGSISAFFKNTLDWLSRLDRKFLLEKKVLLMSTSTGKRGGAGALEYMNYILPKYGANIVESFSFPSFALNFSEDSQTISNQVLLLGFTDVLQNFAHQIGQECVQ
ncbi:NADPH-dependent FMN reductase [Aequorivita marina]|uniref:NADPH-dependent FMN reductase n=1 Tax=Aequorivita marina TaxID=3073654 RepID=UPI0028766A1F|nr:NAD(P)H-dependent oxidoreductase [Aequorivita sp. S2608]MDS1299636.1 NAD(P)H-dependent oxidoreductase [Aequorivita sp. S2608]